MPPPRRLLLATGLLALLLTSPVGCRTSPPTPEGELVTFLDYFETGRRSVEAWLAREHATRLARSIEQAKESCVRVRAVVLPRKRTTRHMDGSGIRVGDRGLVLTAGHGLPDSAEVELDVTETDGRIHGSDLLVCVLEPEAESNGDWAVLRIRDADPDEPAAPAVGFAEEGEIVAVLGYPQGIGIDRKGRVVPGDRDGPGGALEPLVFLARVTGTSPLALRPVAGCVPVHGASGGPVIRASGEVVGLLVSIQPGSGTWYATDMTPILLRFHEELRTARNLP